MIITDSFIDFVREHRNDDVNALRLKYSSGNSYDTDFPLDFALLQIEARRKARKKLPTILENPTFIFPSLIAAEQASNEAIARFHASLIVPCSSLLDLTAGLGIDDLSFVADGINVTACEIDLEKCDALRHNAPVLNVICEDSIEFLKHTHVKYDVIFADPSRRANDGNRLYALSDCMPDIIGNMQLILAHTDRFVVKCSPLLDLSLVINTVESLSHIYVVCFRGECKEVLIDIKKDSDFYGVTCLDLDWNNIISEFHLNYDSSLPVRYVSRHSPTDYKYLYEPNAAIMKTGAWSAIQQHFPELRKADQNTHIFFSDALYTDFPGRILEVGGMLDKRQMKALKGSKMNIVVRNHPLSPQQISRKYSLISAGYSFLYAFRYLSTPTFIQAFPLL